MNLRTLRVAACSSLMIAAPMGAQEWVGPRLHSPSDAWLRPIVPRRLDVSASPTDPSQWVALYAPADFARLRALSRGNCATGSCATRTVHTLASDADVATLKDLLIEPGQHPVLEFVLGVGLDFAAPPSQLIGIAGRFADMLAGLDPEVTGARRRADFETVLARGGEVRYEERLEGSGPYHLVRSVSYTIAVGREVRVFPLWVARHRAEVAAPSDDGRRTLESQLESQRAKAQDASEPVADPPVDEAPSPAPPVTRTQAQCVAEWVPRFAGRWKVTPDRRSESAGRPASTTYWAMTAQGYFDVESESGEVLGSSRFQVVANPAAPGGCVFDVAGRGVHHIERFADGTFTLRRGTEVLRLQPK